MSKAIELKLSAISDNGSEFQFSSSFEQAEIPLTQLEMIYNDAAALVREALLSTEAELEGVLVAKRPFTIVKSDNDDVKVRQQQLRAIRENPGEAASQINRLSKDREKLQAQLGEARQELQAASIPRQKLEDLYARTKARGLAPFALPLDIQQADLQIEKMHQALTEAMKREDKLIQERTELRDRLVKAGLASDEETADWNQA